MAESERSPLREARNGDRCLFCLSDSDDIEQVSQIPKEYRDTNVRERSITLCGDCLKPLRSLFDEVFFENSVYISEHMAEEDGEGLKHLPNTPPEKFHNEEPNICEICGVNDPRVIEQHHLFPHRHLPSGFGKAFKLVDVCSNCHNRIERVYDDYFFNGMGVNTGLVDKDEDTTSESTLNMTIRPLLNGFIQQRCEYDSGSSITSQHMTKSVYDYLNKRGYDYNGGNTVFLRIIDELVDFTSWEHTSSVGTRYNETKYWNFGEYKNLSIPSIGRYGKEERFSRS